MTRTPGSRRSRGERGDACGRGDDAAVRAYQVEKITGDATEAFPLRKAFPQFGQDLCRIRPLCYYPMTSRASGQRRGPSISSHLATCLVKTQVLLSE